MGSGRVPRRALTPFVGLGGKTPPIRTEDLNDGVLPPNWFLPTVSLAIRLGRHIIPPKVGGASFPISGLGVKKRRKKVKARCSAGRILPGTSDFPRPNKVPLK